MAVTVGGFACRHGALKDFVMREDQHRFLTLLGQLPARLNAEQTAWVINCQPHDVPVLVSACLLKPLGSPPANGIKFFCTSDVLELAKDRNWLTRVSSAIHQHWHRQNSRKKEREAAENGKTAATGLPIAAAA